VSQRTADLTGANQGNLVARHGKSFRTRTGGGGKVGFR
jgi:hypothetical protein